MSTADDHPETGPRQTLAMRLAERNRQRALRAERLARLRPGAPADGFGAEPAAAAAAPGADAIDSAEALEEFLRALSGARGEAPRPAQRLGPPPGALLRFERPEPEPAPDPEPGDLDRLTGAGPGLIWALERAGIRRLADLAPLGPEDLAARLGPIGRLVPAEAWLATARAATRG
jgi:predicted flap endonuclease-1-like 5' DNA nuclease